MLRAVELKDLRTTSATGAKQRVYRLEEPLDGFETVVVSTVVAPFTGPETYIFGANRDGEIVHWTELEGSYRGGLDHDEALRRAGYEVVVAVGFGK